MNAELENKKARLKEESEKFEDALTEEFSEFSEMAGDLMKKVLIIGGGALVSYLLIKMILGKDKKDYGEEKGSTKERIYVPATTSAKTIFFRSISDKMALILLELAREMIVKFLKETPSGHEK